MKHDHREVSKDEALRLAADPDIERHGKVNDLEAFRCSECDGIVTCKRGDVPPHFQHRPRYAGDGRRRHKPR